MKKILILKASEDIESAEISNISSQIEMYGIESDIYTVSSYSELYGVLFRDISYDYIYLASHGCETHWGNVSGTVEITWMQFASLVCASSVAKPGTIFLHSCCRGGISQVAWQMFACCPSIEFVCGPRHNISPVDLITSFNLFLYNVEVRQIDPVRSAEKVLIATDIRLLCSDRVEAATETGYVNYCSMIEKTIDSAFEEINYFETANQYVEKPASLEPLRPSSDNRDVILPQS